MADLNLTNAFDFAPSVGEVVLNGLSRIQIRGPMVKTGMLQMASQEANLMQVEWSNRGPNLWTVDAQEVDVDGVAAHGMALDVLDEHGRRGAAVERDLEDRPRTRQGVAQDARVDREELRPAFTPVDDARDLAGTAQTAG